MHEVFETYEDNERLVYWIVNRVMTDYQLAYQERDDLEQEGRIALLKALDLYNSREDLRQYTFATIAFKHIKTRIVRYIDRTIRKHKAVTSLNAPISTEDGDTELQDLLKDEEADTYRTAEQRVESHRIRVALAELTTDEELELLYKHHAFNVALRKLGEAKGVTGERVRQQIFNILRRIRRSEWYLEEYRARLDRDTSFISGKRYEDRPEQRYKRNVYESSPVERAVLSREEEFEAFEARLSKREKRWQKWYEREMQKVREEKERKANECGNDKR